MSLSEKSPPPVVKIREMVKIREQADSRFELHIPALFLYSGEVAAVVGESGCGKSTLLDLLAMVLTPTKCQMFQLDAAGAPPLDIARLWDAEDEAGLAGIRLRHVGYVLQTGGLLPYLTVRQNLFLPPRLNGQKGYAKRIQDTANRFGVGECLNRSPASLSGGQRQRVAILRALAHQPGLVLADEPTAAVDKKRAAFIAADFKQLAVEKKVAVVMVTHDLSLAKKVADRFYGFEIQVEDERTTRSVCRLVSPSEFG